MKIHDYDKVKEELSKICMFSGLVEHVYVEVPHSQNYRRRTYRVQRYFG